MMDAELLAAGETRVFIPSVYRNEYVGSLKRLTNHRDPAGYLRVLSHAEDFVSQIGFSGREAARRTLAACDAFQDPVDDVKLKMLPGHPTSEVESGALNPDR